MIWIVALVAALAAFIILECRTRRRARRLRRVVLERIHSLAELASTLEQQQSDREIERFVATVEATNLGLYRYGPGRAIAFIPNRMRH